MYYVAVGGICAAIFLGVMRFCFRHNVSQGHRGAFALLAIFVAGGALLASLGVVETLRFVRASVQQSFAGTGGLVVPADGVPSGERFLLEQRPLSPKPSTTSAEDWATWQKSLKRVLANDIYGLSWQSGSPESIDAVAPIRESRDGELIRKEYVLEAEDGDDIPVIVLMRTEKSTPGPGVIVVPGHVLDDQSGLAQLVLPVNSYMQSAARELALSGFVTVSIELRGFGMRGPPKFPDHKAVAYNAILGGRFYKSLALSDLHRAMEFFARLPEVDSNRIGIAGVSLGAEIAVEYAALDDRIRAVSFNSYGGRTGPFPPLVGADAAQPHYCHIIPGVNKTLHREYPFLLLAPRPTQGVRGFGEAFADPDFVPELQRAWTALGAPEALELTTVNNTRGRREHLFYVQHAIRFFREKL